jgi:hypothetical protein
MGDSGDGDGERGGNTGLGVCSMARLRPLSLYRMAPAKRLRQLLLNLYSLIRHALFHVYNESLELTALHTTHRRKDLTP